MDPRTVTGTTIAELVWNAHPDSVRHTAATAPYTLRWRIIAS